MGSGTGFGASVDVGSADPVDTDADVASVVSSADEVTATSSAGSSPEADVGSASVGAAAVVSEPPEDTSVKLIG